jgi:hypothetical protein
MVSISRLALRPFSRAKASRSRMPKNSPFFMLKTRIYQTYYAICSSKNPADINKSYNYLEDYNAWTLRIVMEHILTEKQKVNDSE